MPPSKTRKSQSSAPVGEARVAGEIPSERKSGRMTLQELAKITGFSVPTVSSVLNGNGGRHSEKTKEAIRRVAAEFDYHPSRLAQAMRWRRTRTIGIVAYDDKFDTAIRLSQHACVKLQEHNYQPLRVDPGWFPPGSNKLEAFLAGNGVEGVIILGSNPRQFGAEQVSQIARRVPIVGVSAHGSLPLLLAIRSDVRRAFSQAMEHLIATGRKRIVFLSNGGSPESDLAAWNWQAHERLAGVADALGVSPKLLPRGNAAEIAKWMRSSRGEPFAAAFSLPDRLDDFDPFQQAGSYVKAVLAEGALPDAFVCHNDHWAVGAMHVLAEAGIAVPEQVALTGFDDTLIAQYHSCPITTFHQPLEEMACRAVERTLAEIEGLVWDDPRKVELHPCTMVPRRSSEPASKFTGHGNSMLQTSIAGRGFAPAGGPAETTVQPVPKTINAA